jgi:hypothetical protein
MRNYADRFRRENKKHVLKIVPFIVEDYGRAEQTTDGKMAHADCMLDT